MGHDELVRSLRMEADEQARTIWDEAEKLAGEAREESRLETSRINEEFKKKFADKVKAQEEVVLEDARNMAMEIKLLAGKELSERLFSLALSCLWGLNADGRKETFLTLYKELPAVQWEHVEVNSGDLEYASEVFQGASIKPDDNISGGMRVMNRDKKICITNTLEKRLEGSWEDMLPLLIADVRTKMA